MLSVRWRAECSPCLTSSRCSPSQDTQGQTQPSVPLPCRTFQLRAGLCLLLGPAQCPHRADPHQSPCLKQEREEESPPQPQGRTVCSDSRCNPQKPDLFRLSFQQRLSHTVKHRGPCCIQSQHATRSQSSPAQRVLSPHLTRAVAVMWSSAGAAAAEEGSECCCTAL